MSKTERVPYKAATIVMSDWLAKCGVGQWTPFEAATALKAELAREGYAIVPITSPPDKPNNRSRTASTASGRG